MLFRSVKKATSTFISLIISVSIANGMTNELPNELPNEAPNELPLQADTLQEVFVVDQRTQALDHSTTVQSSQIYLKQIEREQRTNIQSFSGIAPNLYIPEYGSRMTSSIYVRGLGTRIDQPAIGVYIDGIGLANKNSFDTELFDIRSAEFYSGPQGSLFGKNTIGGVLSIRTLSPLGYQGTRAEAGYGNGNTANAKVSHYALLTSDRNNNNKWGLAAAVNYKHSDGFFVNIYDNSHADLSDEAAARLRVDGKTESGINVSNNISYQFTEQKGFPYHKPEQAVNHNDLCGYVRHSLSEGLTIEAPIGDYLLGSSTSYQYLNDKMNMDQDYLPASYFTLVQAQQEHFLSEELTFKPKQTIEWDNVRWQPLTGLTLSYQHNDMSAPVTFKQTGIDSLILKNANNGIAASGLNAQLVLEENEFELSSLFTTQQTAVAAYHTSYFNIGKWQIEAGIRLDFQYSAFTYHSSSLLHYRLAPLQTDYRPLKSDIADRTHILWIEPLPRIAASYNEKHWSVYASAAEGYKGGGFNTQLFSDILRQQLMSDMMSDMGVYFSQEQDYRVEDIITYEPERCFTFELGIKGNYNIGDWRLRGSATAYELEVINQQLTRFLPNSTGRVMTNAGHSRSIGCEIQGVVGYKDFTLSINYGLTEARFVAYDNGNENFAGKRVPYVPQHTLQVSGLYHLPLEHKVFKALDFNINTLAVGDIYWNEQNDVRQPFYALLNANIDIQFPYITLELWGKNLTATNYDVFYFVSMNNTFMQSGKPITFGAKIKVEI